MTNLKYKTWNQTRGEIEHTLKLSVSDDTDGEVLIEAGLQLKKTISQAPSVIFGSIFCNESDDGLEKYIASIVAADGGNSFLGEWLYQPSTGKTKLIRRVNIRNCLKKLIWIHSQHAIVGYCDDMTLRGFRGDALEEKVKVHVPHSILCMTYIEETEELITAGQGNVLSWRVWMIEFGRPFTPKEMIICDVNDNIDLWVTKLIHDKETKTLFVVTESAVYVVDMKTRRQTKMVANTHRASLTHCAYFDRFSYLITAARDGTIHIYHTVADALIHRFSGHRDGITGVACLPQEPVLISWSHTSGCLRMWRLDTLELTNETSLSENIAFLTVPRPSRLVYQTESQLRIFDINVVYSVFATLSGAATIFKCCKIRIFKQHDGDEEDELREHHEVKLQRKVSSYINLKYRHFETHYRLLSVLDDRSILSLSPMTGSVLSIIYPLTERDNSVEGLDLTSMGEVCSLILSGGDIAEFDSTVNPGKLSKITTVEDTFKVQPLCMSAVEIKVACAEDGEIVNSGTSIKRLSFLRYFNVIMLGFANGFVKMYKVFQKKAELPVVVLNPVKLHSAEVRGIYHPTYECLNVSHSTCIKTNIINCLITTGDDGLSKIWHINYKLNSFNKLELLLLPIGVIRWNETPTVMTAVESTLFIGHNSGNVTLHKFVWAESNSIGITKIKHFQIDSDLKHQGPVTSADNSVPLKLVVTCGANDPIKLWDTYGQIIREINLGNSVTCACFASGRDLLASLRNHIVRIECTNYLPRAYLELVCNVARLRKFHDVEPEEPIPMDDGADGMLCVMTPEDHMLDVISKAKEQARLEELEKEEQRIKAEEEKAARAKLAIVKAKAAAKELARAKIMSKIKRNMVAVQAVGRFGFALTKVANKLVVSAFNKPKQQVEDDYDLELMQRTPVAPDGYIPNSVIRNLVQSVYPPLSWGQIAQRKIAKAEEEIPDHVDQYSFTKSEINLLSKSDMKLYKDNKVKLSDWEQTGYERVDETTSEEESYVTSTDEEFLKVFGDEPNDEDDCAILAEIFQKFGEKSNRKSPTNLDNFVDVLNEMITDIPKMSEMELYYFIKLVSKLQRTLIRISENEENENFANTYRDGLPRLCQDKLLEKAGSLLSYDWSEMRKAAAQLISNFDDDIIQKAITDHLIPLFLPRVEYSKNITEWKHYNMIKTAASHLSCLVKHLKPSTIKRLRKFGERVGGKGRLGETAAVKAVTVALRSYGIEKSIAEVFGKFIIPLLPHKPEEVKRKRSSVKKVESAARYLSSITSFVASDERESLYDFFKVPKKEPPVISVVNLPSESEDMPLTDSEHTSTMSKGNLTSFPGSELCITRNSQIEFQQSSKGLTPNSSEIIAKNESKKQRRKSMEAIRVLRRVSFAVKDHNVGEREMKQKENADNKTPTLSAGVKNVPKVASNADMPQSRRDRLMFGKGQIGTRSDRTCRNSLSEHDFRHPKDSVPYCTSSKHTRGHIPRVQSLPLCTQESNRCITLKNGHEGGRDEGDWRNILRNLRKKRLQQEMATESSHEADIYCIENRDRQATANPRISSWGPINNFHNLPPTSTHSTKPLTTSKKVSTAKKQFRASGDSKMRFYSCSISGTGATPLLTCDQIKLNSLPWNKEPKVVQLFDQYDVRDDKTDNTLPFLRHKRDTTNAILDPSTWCSHLEDTATCCREKYIWKPSYISNYVK